MSPRANLDSEQVLAAAIAQADAQGFEHLTLASVAAALGIRLPSLYNYVDGLPGLRREISLWGLRRLAEGMRRAAVGRSGADAVLSAARAYRVFAHAHPGAYAATLHAPAPDDVALATAAEEVFAIVAAALRPYHLEGAALVHRVRGLRSVLHGFVSLENAGGFGLPVDLEASFEHLLTVYLRGMESAEAGPS